MHRKPFLASPASISSWLRDAAISSPKTAPKAVLSASCPSPPAHSPDRGRTHSRGS